MPVTTWTAGQVLAAQDLNDTFASKVDYALTANAQSGTGASAYTFVLADASRLTTATGASAKTFTIPPQANVAWIANTIIRVANYGTGDLTIAGGSGVTVTNATKTLAQYESAALVRTGSNAWTLIPFSGGAGNADFSNTATGTYSDSGINYKYLTFTASGTLTVTKAGFADILVVGGGGGGGASSGGGGGGGYLSVTSAYLPNGTLTVTVGAGGGGNGPGNASRLDSYYGVAGGGIAGTPGGSGAGGALNGGGGAGTSGQGNAGGSGSSASGGGGGGANAVGGNGSGNNGGAGGAGTASSITGSSVTRSGGGGGGGNSVGGSGGAGGGGNGAAGSGSPTAGAANTGGGGGAQYLSPNSQAGGSGVVIVRVRV